MKQELFNGIEGSVIYNLFDGCCSQSLHACKGLNESLSIFIYLPSKSTGIHIVLPTSEAVKNAVADGFTFLGLGMDTVFLANGAKQALEMMKDD